MTVEHGGNMASLARHMGYHPEDCIDFSANINPLGLSDRLRESLVTNIAGLVQYPEIDYELPRQALATYHACDLESVLLANGAVDIFYDLARVLTPQKILLLSPTFMEYEKAFRQVGAEVLHHALKAPGYQWQPHDLLPTIAEMSEGDVVLICHPNNPTGSLVAIEELVDLAKLLQDRGLVLVLDEAFADFLENEGKYSFIPCLSDFTNVVVVRSLTKFYAIPGLRLGYAVTNHPTCFKRIEEIRPPWTVNALAADLVVSLLDDEAYRQKTRLWLRKEQAFLYQSLIGFKDLRVVKPSVNYIFFEYLGDLDLRQMLWQKKLFIRSCQDYRGLTAKHYRVAVRRREENCRLVNALMEILGSDAR